MIWQHLLAGRKSCYNVFRQSSIYAELQWKQQHYTGDAWPQHSHIMKRLLQLASDCLLQQTCLRMKCDLVLYAALDCMNVVRKMENALLFDGTISIPIRISRVSSVFFCFSRRPSSFHAFRLFLDSTLNMFRELVRYLPMLCTSSL